MIIVRNPSSGHDYIIPENNIAGIARPTTRYANNEGPSFMVYVKHSVNSIRAFEYYGDESDLLRLFGLSSVA